MPISHIIPNPDLTVGDDNKQRWNQPAHRRHGFHNAHRLFRRTYMVRSRNVLKLNAAPDAVLAAVPELQSLTQHDAFSALSIVRGNEILFEDHAPDFDVLNPHSIQSITKMHIHLIVGRLMARGLLDLQKTVDHYLPNIGLGYATAKLQDLLDMNISNDFSEDYSNPSSDCYTEEIALGWRLPADGVDETNLHDFVHQISGGDLQNRLPYAQYKSANTDVLTLICASVCEGSLLDEIDVIADAVGYEGAFHISLSPERLPAFSGGGCLSARDLARFGQLIARGGQHIHGRKFANAEFLGSSLNRKAPVLPPPKNWLRYSNHLMTDGRLVCHAGYGGQFLMVDTKNGISCAYLSVLENEAGYDEGYMGWIALTLKTVCESVALQTTQESDKT